MRFLHSVKIPDFAHHLRLADEHLTESLKEKASIAAEIEGYWLDESEKRRTAPDTDVHSVLRRCLAQADTVAKLASDLLRPEPGEAVDERPGLRPSNYQLVDASSNLRGHLASLVGLIEQRDKVISNMRSELDILHEHAQQLVMDATPSRTSILAPSEDAVTLMEDMDDDGDDDANELLSSNPTFHISEAPGDELSTPRADAGNDHEAAGADDVQEGTSAAASIDLSIAEYTAEEELREERKLRPNSHDSQPVGSDR